MESDDTSRNLPGDEDRDDQHDGSPPGAAGEPPQGDGDVPGGTEPRMSRRAAWLAMGAVALAIALVWVAPGTDDSQGEGQQAPLNFTLKDMNGVDVKLSSFKGKVIVVNFWATWCGPCELEIPSLVEIQKAYRDEVVVLGVSIDDTAEMLKPYAAKMQMNYPVLIGLDRQDVQDAFGPLFGIPVTVFVDRDGNIAKRHSGIASKDEFVTEIRQLL